MSRLGELLVRENLISLPQLQKAQEEQRKTGARLGYSLAKLGHHHRRGAHRLPLQAVRRPGDQPRRVRDRPRGDRSSSRPECAPSATAHPGQPRRLVAHRRDGRPVEPPRHRRHQVPHRLQHRVGGRLARSAIDEAIERYYEQQASLLRRGHGELRRRGDRVRRRRRGASTSSTSRSAREDAPVVKLVQRDPAQRDQEGRERHPHRAVREDAPRALPHRRRALRGDARRRSS